MGRPPCCDKSNVKRGLWTAEEDAKILAHVSIHGTGNWTSVPKKAGLKRCGKSCRLRWTNYLRPDLKHDNFTPQEEELIVNLHATIGSRWSLIADQLPGRTDNDVKNYWNTKLRKKLHQMGIDPVTHKPFSQIFADYGKISGLQKPSSRIGSLNRDLKNAFMVKSESSSITQDEISNVRNQSMMSTRNPIQDGVPLNQYNINNNYSWDLLAQLQAIKLMTEASNCTNQEIIQPHFFSEGSSSSSSNVIQVDSQPLFNCPSPNMAPSPFCWSEFLQEDVFLPHDQQKQEEEDLHGLSSTGSSNQINDEILQSEFDNGDNKNFNAVTTNGYTGDIFGASLSSDNSFVDDILDRDSQMLWEFPSLLDESFY